MKLRRSIRGNALLETLVALLALAPFIGGIVLLGKQLDVKHKTYEAARYSVWERTVWRSDGIANRKLDADIAMEGRDRILGDPRAAVLASAVLGITGVTENPLWHDAHLQRMLGYEDGAAFESRTDRRAPVETGYVLIPGVAHGEGVLRAVEDALQLSSLNLDRRTFIESTAAIDLRALFGNQKVIHRANAAVLSDTWSPRDESALRERVDNLTTNELIEALERPGRPLGLHAPAKGQPLFGEGQFGWDPDLQPRSSTLPAAYIARPRP